RSPVNIPLERAADRLVFFFEIPICKGEFLVFEPVCEISHLRGVHVPVSGQLSGMHGEEMLRVVRHHVLSGERDFERTWLGNFVFLVRRNTAAAVNYAATIGG